eukprot:6444605-Karenia_brevis.AAC.1
MNALVTSENKHCFVEAQRRRRVALFECSKSRMYDIIAESAANSGNANEAPVYVLLRGSAVSKWIAYDVRTIWEEKIGPQARRFSHRCNSVLNVDHFKALAFSLHTTYAGPATETGGADVS